MPPNCVVRHVISSAASVGQANHSAKQNEHFANVLILITQYKDSLYYQQSDTPWLIACRSSDHLAYLYGMTANPLPRRPLLRLLQRNSHMPPLARIW